jgi:3-hydroxy-9,10-secoandrosta-1,3,5(10)-triene-9,17-dione monooxygenase reductase component
MSSPLISIDAPANQEPSLYEAMQKLAGGVTVITTGIGDDRTGLTATSVASLSLAPPSMIICVNRNASAWPMIKRYRHFCVNVLAHHHRDIAERFSGRDGLKGKDRYATARWTPLATGALALEDALAAVDCELEDYLERHTHAIVIGAVRAVRLGEGDALLRARGGYGTYASSEL